MGLYGVSSRVAIVRSRQVGLVRHPARDLATVIDLELRRCRLGWTFGRSPRDPYATAPVTLTHLLNTILAVRISRR